MATAFLGRLLVLMGATKMPSLSRLFSIRKRWLALGAVALLALLLGLLALAAVRGWLLDWALDAAVRASDGRLTIEEVHRLDGGATAGLAPDGVTIGKLRWLQPDGTSLDAQQIRLVVRWSALWQRELSLFQLRSQRMAIKVVLSDKPLQLPPAIELPGKLRVDDVAIDTIVLTVGTAAPIELKGVRFALDYRNHKYTVNRLALTEERGTLEGRLQVTDAQPYVLEADTRVFIKVPSWTDPVLADLKWRGDSRAVSLQGNANLRETRIDFVTRLLPLAQEKLTSLDWAITDFRSNRFVESALPLRLQLSGTLEPKLPLRSTVVATNMEPGRLDTNKLPLEQANAKIEFADNKLRIDGLRLQLMGQGEVSGSAQIDLEAPASSSNRPVSPLERVRVDLQVKKIKPAIWYAGLVAAELSGKVRIDAKGVDFDLREAGTLLEGGIAARGLVNWNDERVLIEKAELSARNGQLSTSGRIGLTAPNHFELHGDARRFEIQRWFQWQPIAGRERLEGLINGSYVASGSVKPQPQALISVNLRDSRLVGLPLAGTVRAQLHGEPRRVSDLDTKLVLGANKITASGAYGQTDDRLDVRLQSDALNQLDSRLAGRIDVNAQIRGATATPQFKLSWTGSALQWQGNADKSQPPLRLATIRGNAEFALDPASPLEVQVNASGLRLGEMSLDQLTATTRGLLSLHQFSVSGSGAGQSLRASGQGELDLVADDANGAAWRARIDKLDSDGRVAFAITAPMKLAVGSQNYSVEGLDARAFAGRIRIDQALLGASAKSVQARGEFSAVRLDEVLASLVRLGLLAAAPSNSGANAIEVRADGRFDLSGSSKDDLSGSLSFDARTQPVEVRSSGNLKFNAGVLSGNLKMQLPSLAWAKRFAGDEWQIDGLLDFDGQVAGTLSAPQLQGDIVGSGLRLEQRLLGWRFSDGKLKGRFEGDRLRIEQLRLDSDSGFIELSGQLRLPSDGLSNERLSGERGGLSLGNGEFELRASRLPLSSGPGQRFVLSGDTKVTVLGNKLSWTGTLVADEGLIELKDLDAASTPSDLVIVDKRERADSSGQGAGALPAVSKASAPVRSSSGDAVTVQADLKLNLGKRFRVVGGGVEARLAGELALGGTLPGTPTANGIVQVLEGKYRAYGQDLSIDRGRLIFNGRLDNPTLDIVAIRKFLPVEAGVALGGTALAPRTRLVSRPEVPDADKLSWLVLGVSLEDAGGSASSAALQAAAIALFGDSDSSTSGGIASALGLDVLGVRGASSTSGFSSMQGGLTDARIPGQVAASSVAGSASQNVVTAGKRLSSRLFVSYEQGLRGVWNLLKIQYDISNRFSLRALTGSESAIDLLYFFSFD